MPTPPAPKGAILRRGLSMQERMARGLHQKDFERNAPVQYRWVDLGDGIRQRYREDAAACLDCLTVAPTDEMVEAGHKINTEYAASAGDATYTLRGAVSHVFEAMVATMIAEGK
ncbi:MAG: hypothetical protein WCP82_05010 [Alphaproteobacteria bacterium]